MDFSLPYAAAYEAFSEGLTRFKNRVDALKPGSNIGLKRAETWMTQNCMAVNLMDAMLYLHPHMSRANWLRLLGAHWTDCERPGIHAEALKAKLGTFGPIRELMTRYEYMEYRVLPNVITIYRGCDADKVAGLSWATDRQVANSYPYTYSDRQPDPVVITASVLKEHVLAVKSKGSEQEILTFEAVHQATALANEDEAIAYFKLCEERRQKFFDSLPAPFQTREIFNSLR